MTASAVLPGRGVGSRSSRLAGYGVVFQSARMLIGAASTLFLVSRGLGLADVVFLKSVQSAVILATDLPLGYLADRFSRRALVAASSACAAGWLLCTAYSPHVWWLYLGEALNAVSIALFNGAFDAYYIEMYRADGRAGDPTEALARLSRMNFGGMAAAALVGCFIPDLASPVLWWTAGAVVTALTLSSFAVLARQDGKSYAPRRDASGPKGGSTAPAGMVRALIDIVLRLRRARYYVLLGVLLNVYYQVFIQFWQPVVQAAFPAVSAPAFYAAVFFLVMLVQSPTLGFTRRLARGRRSGMQGVALLLVGLTLAEAGLHSWPYLTLLGILVFFFSFRSVSNLVQGETHARIDDAYRASVVSSTSTLVRIAMLITAPLLSLSIRAVGVQSVVVYGILLAAAVLLMAQFAGRGNTGRRFVKGIGSHGASDAEDGAPADQALDAG